MLTESITIAYGALALLMALVAALFYTIGVIVEQARVGFHHLEDLLPPANVPVMVSTRDGVVIDRWITILGTTNGNWLVRNVERDQAYTWAPIPTDYSRSEFA